MQMIRCPRCAKEVFGPARFCRRCGCAMAPLAGPSPAHGVVPLPVGRAVAMGLTSAGPKRQPAPRKSSSGGVLVGVIALVAFAGFMGQFTKMGGRPATPTLPSNQPFQFPRIESMPVRVNPPLTYPAPAPINPPMSIPTPMRSMPGLAWPVEPRNPPMSPSWDLRYRDDNRPSSR